MNSPIRVATAAALLVGGLSVTACESSTPTSSDDGRTVVAFTADQPLSDDLLKQAAGQIRRRAELVGLKDPRVTAGSGVISLSVAGPVGDKVGTLGHQPVLEIRPVVAASPAQAPLSPKTAPPPLGTVPAQLLQQFSAFDCAVSGAGAQAIDPTTDAVACDSSSVRGPKMKFVLGPAAIRGTDVAESTASQDIQNGSGWQVNLRFSPEGAASFATLTGQLAVQREPANQLAIVLDGSVVSHPYLMQAITGGAVVISADFTEDQAKALAAQISTGKLPVELHASTPAQSTTS